VQILEELGAVVDLRIGMHQKLLLIDDNITWTGSLNLLSHSGSTRELMLRVEGRRTALTISAFLSADASATSGRAAGSAYKRENPLCGICVGRTRFMVDRNGEPIWSCERCSWTRSPRAGRETRRGRRNAGQSQRACSACGRPMWVVNGRYGPFWGCTGFPSCKETMPWASGQDCDPAT
jgi:hypothetical protein